MGMINIIDDGFDSMEEELLPEEERKARERAKKMIAKPIQLRPEREAQFLAEYGKSVVHDFGDVYHLSEEERIAKNKFYSAFKKLSTCKHKYKKLDQYVTAMREAIKCLNLIAENNGYYDPDKFKKLFYKKEITIAGLFVPQYKGSDRKALSKEYLYEFIMSDKPAEDIIPKNIGEDDIDEMEEEIDILSDEEIDKIINDTPMEINDEDDDFTEKKMAKLMKRMPEVLMCMKNFQKEKSKRSRLSQYAYEMSGDSLSNIERYESKYNIDKNMPKFKGDLINKHDFQKYMYELEEWENNNLKFNYNGKLKTPEEIDNIELKTELERSGWNMRKLYENKEEEARRKALNKAEKKKEKELRRRLTEVEHRRKRREMGEDVSDEKKLSKKKLKKLKKKGKKQIDAFLSGE